MVVDTAGNRIMYARPSFLLHGSIQFLETSPVLAILLCLDPEDPLLSAACIFLFIVIYVHISTHKLIFSNKIARLAPE